jgi:DNA-binding transcriptional LysR family regulator
MDRTHRLEMLVRAADGGSFASAARALDRTPSAISRGISELERSLQVTLFNRTTRQLQLTEDGQQVYRQAVDILERMGELEGSVRSRPAKIAGTVRVGVAAPLNRHVLMPRIASFQSRYPDIHVDLRTTQDPKAMQAENIDVLLHVGEPPPSRLIAQRLGQGRPAAYASPDYLRRFGEPLDPDELAGHACLVFNPPFLHHPAMDWRFERGGVGKLVRVPPTMVSTDREGLLVAAMSGAGIVYLACFDPAVIASVQLRRLFPQWTCPESFNIHIMYRRNSNPVPRVAAFVQFARESFAAFDPEELTIVHASSVASRQTAAVRSGAAKVSV